MEEEKKTSPKTTLCAYFLDFRTHLMSPACWTRLKEGFVLVMKPTTIFSPLMRCVHSSLFAEIGHKFTQEKMYQQNKAKSLG